MRLFIAEKPSVAEAIAAGLGGGKKDNGHYKCGSDVVTWCFGHMMEMAPPDEYTPENVPRNGKGNKLWRFDELPILPDQWKLQPKSTAKKQLGVIKSLLNQCDTVINAGDIDREGQNLVDEILDFYNFKGKELRYWCSSLALESVQKALAELRPNQEYRAMGDASIARACADWLIGMNLSRGFTLANNQNGGSSLLTVGRVQSPTLRLVVERDRAIENFKPKPYFNVIAMVAAGSETPYKAVWQPGNAQAGLDDESRLIDGDIADQLCGKNVSGSVVDQSTTPKAQRPPLCYSLSDIQFSANKLFGYDAEKTLSICQSLYETHKVVTYPRTDCGYIPEEMFDDASKMLSSIVMVASSAYSYFITNADLTIKSKTWDSDKVTAHHGIVPTVHAETDIGNLSTDEQNIYDLIVRRFIAQFYPPFRYEQTTILHDFNGEKFKSSGRVVVNQGWKEVVSIEAEAIQKKNEDEGVTLPKLKSGQSVVADIEKKQAKTTAPKRFTEGDLIKAMQRMHLYLDDPEMKKLIKDNEGLGTEATRAGIISELKRRQFLVVSKKNLVSSDRARELIDVLPSDVTSPLLSAQAEKQLSAIAKGEVSKEAFIEDQKKFVRLHVERVKNSNIKIASDDKLAEQKKQDHTHTCPNCNKRKLIGPKKKKRGSGCFWMCQGVFDENDQCKSFFEDDKGKPILKKVVKRAPKKSKN